MRSDELGGVEWVGGGWGEWGMDGMGWNGMDESGGGNILG